MGIQPDIIVCRTERPLEPGIKDKIALFCNVPTDHVMQNLDVETLYEAPLAMEKEHLADCLQVLGVRLQNTRHGRVADNGSYPQKP